MGPPAPSTVDGEGSEPTPPLGRPPRRQLPLRVRSALAFALMALLLSSALSFAAYALVRSSLLTERQVVAERQAYTNARLLRSRVDPLPPDMSQLLAGLQVGGTGDSLLRIGGKWFSSSVQITSSELPASLAAAVATGDAGVQTFERFGSKSLAVGVPIAAVDAEYFEISSLEEVEATLGRLGRSLLIAGTAATVLGGVLGASFGSLIMRPLRRFADVAERITSGGSTSRRRAEDAGSPTRLEAAGDADLQPLANAFNEMLDELDERIERERRFASDVSHEIRGPVAALASAVSIVDRRRGQLPAEIVPVVDALDEQVKAFNGLVLDLLEISRFDARTAALEATTLDPGALCRQVLDSRGYDGVQLAVDGVDTLVADRRRLEQVLSNLLENAARYGGGATDIRIERTPQGPVDDAARVPSGADGSSDVVTIRVEDRGPGVAPGERERIFDRFERGRAADEPGAPRGTGLGLALSKQHVELHGGRVWVEDRPGGGASFVVELPGSHP